MMEGHNKNCYYCGQLCDSLAANPGLWPIPLFHKNDPGKVNWHHIRCVTRKLIENISNEDLIKELHKRLNNDPASS